MNSTSITVVLVEDNEDQREALALTLKGSPGFTFLGAFATAEQALAKIPRLAPDVVLMDINLPAVSGVECVRRLKPLVPGIRIMMLTVFEDHDRILDSLRAGASGYLVKKTPPAKLLEAIQEIHAGGAPMSAPIARQVIESFREPVVCNEQQLPELTKREQQILDLLNRGFLYKEIADSLGMSRGTVNTHISHIYDKLHVRSRAEAMIKVSLRR